MMNGRMAGQTINDRLLAAKHSIAGQGLAKAVCKATTEEMIGPKKKHLDYLVHCTNEPNVSIPQLANLLIERSQNTNWVVVYKALVTVHHLMCYGNERFTQYLASSNSTFQLNNFLDKSGVQGMLSVRTGYDMSPFIRRYAQYLNEKALSYRTVAFDFCKVKRGKDDGVLRTMNAEKLLKTIPTLQNQLDALLLFDCNANDLTNGVINMCFMLLFRDLIRLFACYNDGIINLLEKYFDMNRKQCREALDIYKKFLTRMDKVAEFLKVAENVGIDKGDIPDLTKAPSSLLDALEQHLASLEGKKTSNVTSGQSASNQKNVRSGVSALSSTSNSFGIANGRLDSQVNGIDESLKLQALAEEEAAMNQFKSKVSPPSHQTANPFLSNSSSASTISSQSQQPQVDFFSTEPQIPVAKKTSDDLLQLGNPFMDSFPQPAPVAAPIFAAAPPQQQHQQPQQNIWMNNTVNGNGLVSPVNSSVASGAFVTDSNFSSVFGNTDNKSDGFDSLGGVLQPTSLTGSQTITNGNTTNIKSENSEQQKSTLLTGDLESSLASLAENLSINSRPQPVKGVQWNSPKNGSRTGSSWTPQPISATTGAGYKPMNQSMVAPQPITLQTPIYPQVHPMMGLRPMATTTPLIPQLGGMSAAAAQPTNPMSQPQSLLFH